MAANIAQPKDRKAVMRDKRAQGIAAMGLVTREGDRFRVAAPTLRGRKATYEVWRDESGRVRCSCPEFEVQSQNEPTFRCEHVLAVKHSLLLKNTEAVNKKQPQSASTQAVAVPNTNEGASEKHFAAMAQMTIDDERFERERIDTDELVPTASEVLPLANDTNIEEQVMMKKQEKTGLTPVAELESNEPEILEEQAAPVVPIAFTNTLKALKQRIDPSQIRTREGWTDRQGNTHIVEYVEWHTVADILDRVTPSWSHSVKAIQLIGDTVAVIASITIDGVTREGIGTGAAETEMGIKKAEHDALKRAAVKFGIARELYQRESEVIEKQGTTPATGQFPRDPLAKSMADLVTPKQLGMIRALAREAGVDADEECTSVLSCKTEELSKRAASSFIDHLKNGQQEAAGTMRRAS
jgi:hypothetical protein